MPTAPDNAVTRLLNSVGQGDEAARQELWGLLHHELHRVAKRYMAGQAPGQTLQTTALVNEVYLRLMGGDGRNHFANRKHFFVAAAAAMRRILIDYARKRGAEKRGGDRKRVELFEGPAVFDPDPTEALTIDDALERLKATDPRAAEVVMLRYHAGLNGDETAEVLGVSPRTVDNDWQFARAWLRRDLSEDDKAKRPD